MSQVVETILYKSDTELQLSKGFYCSREEKELFCPKIECQFVPDYEKT